MNEPNTPRMLYGDSTYNRRGDTLTDFLDKYFGKQLTAFGSGCLRFFDWSVGAVVSETLLRPYEDLAMHVRCFETGIPREHIVEITGSREQLRQIRRTIASACSLRPYYSNVR